MSKPPPHHRLLKDCSFTLYSQGQSLTFNLCLFAGKTRKPIWKVLLKSRFLSLTRDWGGECRRGEDHSRTAPVSSLANVYAANLAPANKWTLRVNHWEWFLWFLLVLRYFISQSLSITYFFHTTWEWIYVEVLLQEIHCISNSTNYMILFINSTCCLLLLPMSI